MNTINKKALNRRSGFTIIEVVLVLAIAGLIFLMVFIALPSLQQGQRDTQRKNDLSRINTQLTSYASSARGKVPHSGNLSTFASQYLKGDYTDPNGTNYTMQYNKNSSIASPTEGTVYYSGPEFSTSTSGFLCDDSAPGTVKSVSGSRKYALRVKLEGQAALYCLDNR